MKSLRLLPVVVFASLALLTFKTIGLVTSGGYVLVGTQSAVAAGGGHGAEEPVSIPSEPTLEDKAPTLTDGAPTMPLIAGEEPEAGAAAPDMAVDAASDQPISETERAILNRLAERRTELDGRESEYTTRLQLVEAAERKLAERAAALQAIEARINTLVQQQKSADEAQFKGLVSMYENMKPTEAAKIFDTLDMDVLLRVAKAINPRKMAPILAKMNANVAQMLTVKLAAVNPVTQPVTMASSGLDTDLPQIVGQ